MLRAIRYHLARKRFQRMVETFDKRIAEARAKHKPVRPIEREKSAFVHQCLERRA